MGDCQPLRPGMFPTKEPFSDYRFQSWTLQYFWICQNCENLKTLGLRPLVFWWFHIYGTYSYSSLSSCSGNIMKVTNPSWKSPSHHGIYIYIRVYIYKYIHISMFSYAGQGVQPAAKTSDRSCLMFWIPLNLDNSFFRNILSQPGFSSLSFGVKILNKYATFQSINQKKTYQLLPSVTWTDHPNGGHLTPEKVTNKTLKCRSLVDTFEKLFSPPKKKHPFWNSWRAKSSWHQVLSPSCFCGTAPNIAAKRAVEAASGPRERVE